MKTKLLKTINRRFSYVYDHENKEWVVSFNNNPLFLLKPLKDYSMAECMASITIGVSYVSHKRSFKFIDDLYKKLNKFNKDIDSINTKIK